MSSRELSQSPFSPGQDGGVSDHTSPPSAHSSFVGSFLVVVCPKCGLVISTAHYFEHIRDCDTGDGQEDN